ncbi:MAG: hypothetical protein CMJ78_03380 [Planctomycetaceae bacterium]|nr:hypothetical protein [Planctomycetaceae bacterium]
MSSRAKLLAVAWALFTGHAQFMAPEQAEGKEVTTVADVYSLGAILYQILTGQPPHREANAVATLVKVINEDAAKPSSINPNVDRNLEAVCLKCLERDPEKRYESGRALVTAALAALVATVVSSRLMVRVPLHIAWFALLGLLVSRVTVSYSQAEIALLLQEQKFDEAIELLDRHIENEPRLLNERIILCSLLAHEGRNDEWKAQLASLNARYGHVIEPGIMRWHSLLGLLKDDNETKWRSIGYAKWSMTNERTSPGNRAWCRISSALGAVRNNNADAALVRLDAISWPPQSQETIYGVAIEKVIRLLALPKTKTAERDAVRNELDQWLADHKEQFQFETARQAHMLLIYRTLLRETVEE